MTVIPTLPGSTTATVNDSGKPTKDDYNWRTQLNGLLRKNSFLANPGTANQLLVSDGSNPGYEDLTALLDALFGTAEGTIIARGASAWDKLDPADGYLKNTSGVLSWGAVSAPPQWELISTTTVSGVTSITGLGGYQELLLIFVGITQSATGALYLLASTNNGSSFMSSSGNYWSTVVNGSKSDTAQIDLTTSATTSAIYTAARIIGPNLATPKLVDVSTGSTSFVNQFISTTSAVNAFQMLSSGVGTPNGGTIYALGLPTA